MANKLWLAAVLVLASGAASSQVNPNQLKWGPAPPGLPPGAQLAVLSGNPGAAGPFVIRVRFPAGYTVRPHRHPTDEYVTVISGNVSYGTGERFRPATIRSIHADGDTVIVLWDGHGVANDGQPYKNSYAWFMTMCDAKVIDGTAFYDSISFNELWNRVRPQS